MIMLDLIIVITYLAILMVVGVVYRSKMVRLKDFSQSVGSLKRSKFFLIATLFASAVGGGTTFGMTEKVFSNNLALVYGMLLTVPIDILIGIYIVPLFAKFSGVTSIGEIMQRFYGLPGRVITGLAALLTSLGYLAAQISVSGKIFQYLLGVDAFVGVVSSYVIIISYTAIGGLRSVMVTNMLQFIAMMIAIPTITVLGLYNIGLENFTAQLQVEQYSLADRPLLLETLSAALGFAVMGIPPTFVQRIILNKNSSITTSAIIYKSLIYFVFIALIGINGLVAAQIIPVSETHLVVPLLIDQIIPTGLKGVVIIGLLASVMSTADSDLNVASTSIVNDIFKCALMDVSSKKVILLAQVLTAIIGVFAIILAMFFTNVVDLVVFIASFWVPIIIVPMLFAAMGRVIAQKEFLFSVFVTIIILYIWHMYFSDHVLRAVFVGVLTHIILFYLFWLRSPQKIQSL